MMAADAGHAAVVAQLLAKEDIRLNTANVDGATPLMLAAQEGHVSYPGSSSCSRQLWLKVILPPALA